MDLEEEEVPCEILFIYINLVFVNSKFSPVVTGDTQTCTIRLWLEPSSGIKFFAAFHPASSA